MSEAFESRVAERVRALAASGSPSPGGPPWWSERMLGWAMSHPSFRTQLFRFVDVFPATVDDADIVAHLDDYLHAGESPRVVDLAVEVAEHLPGGRSLAAALARRNVAHLAHQFIVGVDPAEAVVALRRLWDHEGVASTVDLLGERTVSEAEADRYAARVANLLEVLAADAAEWAPRPELTSDDLGPLARVNVSVKATALAPSFQPLDRGRALASAAERLRPLLHRARALGAFVSLDAEHYDVKDLTLTLVRQLLEEPELADLEVGVVVQAYLLDARDDLADVIALSAARPRPLTVRLVKGAYWDTETVLARARGWPSPVFERKELTDASYERCTRMLLDHHGEVRAAFASHNLRSVAYAMEYADRAGVPPEGYEVQVLAGMGEDLGRAVTASGRRCRVYAPVGQLLPGMAYLVRRLLENTSNEGFLRQRFAEHRDLAAITAPPPRGRLPEPAPLPPRRPTPATDPGPYRPEPVVEWRRVTPRTAFAAAVERMEASGLGRVVPAVIGGREVRTEAEITSWDPSRPGREVARSAACGPGEVDAAVVAAAAAWPRWRDRLAAERAQVLFDAAAWLRGHRHEVAALEVFEAGKPWPEADADVCEAIDFCEYYGRRALELARGGPVDSPPGERNELRYVARGVGAVIAPWNFPLAIPTGMTAAALVVGNAVVLKPAEQTPATAAVLVQALEHAGLPPGVLGFLPGTGEGVGRALVAHPEVSFVAFTGSRAVGLEILAGAATVAPGARHVTRVVAEMGGKNPIVVDADADLDEAVGTILTSAFAFAGQKCSACSRLVVLDAVHDVLVERLAGAVRVLPVGPARDMATVVGPLIDAEARARVEGYVELARRHGRVVTSGIDVPEEGHFVAPTVACDLDPASPVLTEEIFGPVLAVQRAGDLEEAVALANATDYALTAGLLSRSPSHIAWAAPALRAGNVYVNRPITGAVVGRQPFGGLGLSGVGSKAGGPDYLQQFVDPLVISESTLRQGFAPSEP